MGTTQLPNPGRRRALDARIECAILPIRVPCVYLTWANPVFLPFFPLNRINKLRVFNVAFSSIPTAPTNFLHSEHFIGAFDTNKAFDTNCPNLQRTVRSVRIGSPQHRAVECR
jgi:hypothetical protein